MAICFLMADSGEEHQHLAECFQDCGDQQKNTSTDAVNERKKETKYHHISFVFNYPNHPLGSGRFSYKVTKKN